MDQQLNWKTVSLTLLVLLGLAFLFAFAETASGNFIAHNPIWFIIAIVLTVLAISAPISSLVVVCMLVFSPLTAEKRNLGQYIWASHIDILIAYALFWYLIISQYLSMSVVYLNGGRSPFLSALVLVLALSAVFLAIKSFTIKDCQLQGMVLFLFLLVSGALLLNLHDLLNPDSVPEIIAKYPSPDTKYMVLKFKNDGYGLQVKGEQKVTRLGNTCYAEFIKWVDKDTMAVFADGPETVDIKNGKFNIECPID